jgi:hypothetical protein
MLPLHLLISRFLFQTEKFDELTSTYKQ